MKKRRTVILAGLILVLFISSYFALNSHSNVQNNKEVSLSFSERLLNHNELLTLSDSIVVGKIAEFKEKKVAIKENTMDNGEKFKVKSPYSVYTLEVTENLKGNTKKKKVDVVFMGDKPDYINLGEEYILFLEKNNIDKDKYYSLISYSQGFYKLDSDTDTWKNRNTGSEFKMEELINDIKSFEW